MEGKGPGIRENLEDSINRVEQTALTCCPDLPGETFAAQLEAFLALSRRIESLTSALDREI
jgi:hypothetical protein